MEKHAGKGGGLFTEVFASHVAQDHCLRSTLNTLQSLRECEDEEAREAEATALAPPGEQAMRREGEGERLPAKAAPREEEEGVSASSGALRGKSREEWEREIRRSRRAEHLKSLERAVTLRVRNAVDPGQVAAQQDQEEEEEETRRQRMLESEQRQQTASITITTAGTAAGTTAVTAAGTAAVTAAATAAATSAAPASPAPAASAPGREGPSEGRAGGTVQAAGRAGPATSAAGGLAATPAGHGGASGGLQSSELREEGEGGDVGGGEAQALTSKRVVNKWLDLIDALMTEESEGEGRRDGGGERTEARSGPLPVAARRWQQATRAVVSQGGMSEREAEAKRM